MIFPPRIVFDPEPLAASLKYKLIRFHQTQKKKKSKKSATTLVSCHSSGLVSCYLHGINNSCYTEKRNTKKPHFQSQIKGCLFIHDLLFEGASHFVG